MKPHAVRFAPSYWLWVAGWVTAGALLGFLPSVLGGCSHDFIDLGDGGGCPDAEPGDTEGEDTAPAEDAGPESDAPSGEAPGEATDASDAGTDGAPSEDAGAPPDAAEDAEEEATTPDAPPDAPEEEGAPEMAACDPAACRETCASYGYPAGTCDDVFCLCGDGTDAGGTDDTSPPREDCHDRRDNDGDDLVDCRDPDCWALIYCHCDPPCPPDLVCRAGTCGAYP